MLFDENCLLTDISHEISYLIFSSKIKNDVSSAAVVVGALRVNGFSLKCQQTWNSYQIVLMKNIFSFYR